jgi:dTMP kinase
LSGKFITFEGIDGSGKSTQLRLLADRLRAKSLDVITTCEPGGTPLGRQLRTALLDTAEAVAPLAELLLFAADRAQHVQFLIRPAIDEGKVVLSDRYADATAAYQGAGRGFPQEVVSQVIELATGGLKPDLTIFLDLPVATASGRMAERTEKGNRMDAETADFYNRVRDAYLQYANAEPERFRVIDGTRAPDEIQADVLSEVEKILD